MTNCQYANDCDKNDTHFCLTCRHNRGKRDHYNPDPFNPWPKPYYFPYNDDPVYPKRRYDWVINCGDGCCGQKKSYRLGQKTPYFV